ncbi:Tafazzin [Trichostrongylus colubriformis]|uniref:Tafazzin family protein n=1 Tax=Trichostrongylus colubriformis TaxID=6319 RepID=A0AAN8IF07_TRICO
MNKQILWMYRGRELVTNSHSLVPCSSRSFGSFLFGKVRILRFNRWLQRRETGTQVDKAAALEGFRFPWPFPEKPSRFYNMVSYLTLGTVASVSKLLFVRVANELVVHNKERFMNIWMDRSRPLITISNHRSNIDDPLMWSFITTPEMCRNIDRHRYTLAAHNICFTKPLHTRFFSLGRCVPCVRGEGVYQKGMDFCVDKLNENGWVHMFPEGRVTMEPLRFKWGVGRLVEDTVIPPVILPIWCTNMSSVWPIDPPYYPRFGHRVDIHIGEVLDSKVILDELSVKNGWSVAKRRKFITDVLQTELFKLGEAVGNLTKGDRRSFDAQIVHFRFFL